MLNWSTQQADRNYSFWSVAILAPLTGALACTSMPLDTSFAQEVERQVQATQTDVDGLLAQARKAMDAGQFSEVESLLERAEAAKRRYPMLHFGDTPARVRHDLKKLRRAATRKGEKDRYGRYSASPATSDSSAVTKPSSRTIDPFVTAIRAMAVRGGEPPEESDDVTQDTQLTGTPPHLNVPESDTKSSPRAQSDADLIAARRALAYGDVSLARTHWESAQKLQVTYAASEDSPRRVGQSIAECEQLSVNQGNTPVWRLGYAKFLLVQADALIGWGDLESAERAANEASALQPNLETADTSPTDVLSQIRELRNAPELPASTDVSPDSIATAKSHTLELLRKARTALQSGDLATAEQLAGQASQLNVPDSQFAPHEDRPAKLAADLQRARDEVKQVQLAGGPIPLDLTLPNAVSQLKSTPQIAQLPKPEELKPLPEIGDLMPEPVDPFDLMRQGEQALRNGDRGEALQLFRSAHAQRHELDPLSQEQLQDHLQMLSAASPRGRSLSQEGSSLLSSANSSSTVVTRQLSTEIGKRQSEASRLRSEDPNGALQLLRESSDLVANSELDESTKKQLLRRVELSIAETERYINDHQSEIDLDQANREVLEDIDRQREVRLQVQQRIAELVDQFNQLRDERRYAEMEVVAKRLYDMTPEEPIAQQVWESAKFIRRSMLNLEIDEMTDEGVVGIFQGIRHDAAQGLLDADTAIRYDGQKWADLENRRGSSDLNSRKSARELEIQQKLRIPVMPRYTDMPLAEVVESLADLADVNIHLDARGLGQEGVRSDTLVNLNPRREISLESALNLILEPLHLTFMIKDEVLKITSEQLRDGEVYAHSYNVADLVVPIPNFVPSPNIGLQGLINDAYAAMPNGNQSRGGPITVVAGSPPAPALGPAPGNVMQQQFGTTSGGGPSIPMSGGPGPLGGAASADFDSLIDLIVSTVEHDTWMENGTGEGEIQPFPTNLSLVISQTQPVHEKIADLLEQLRRLQDLQVTIEVRFIRLTDSFFERIGVDFDFNIEDGSRITDLNNVDSTFEPNRASATVGISAPTSGIGGSLPTFTADLDVPFRQDSFGLASPAFGSPRDIGQFGFAILSDIEAFFLINAAQGDSRANILQAPKVTLFNGQIAQVIDASFKPFVISVIPVVGEFAAAQQPVIVVLSEGTMMSVQAVVSDDRRYVRLTLVPFFSQIGEVTEFTFEGSETSSISSNTTDQDDDGNNESNDAANTVTRTGVTVQLPTFQIIAVATTVSVPDGGTVLLGGIKRLKESRSEFGVPLLSKVPYIDRLFRNVGIGRETDSLMMMVTPHIIIQEEEEERLGISTE